MSQALQIADGRCIASGQSVTPFVIERLMTVLCPECGADVPLLATEDLDGPEFTIISHSPRQTIGGKRLRGTQLMFGF
jgi:hypothetical protein